MLFSHQSPAIPRRFWKGPLSQPQGPKSISAEASLTLSLSSSHAPSSFPNRVSRISIIPFYITFSAQKPILVPENFLVPPQGSSATMDALSAEDKPPVFNYILSFLLVGIAWGGTTPFIRIAAKSHKPPHHKILDDPAVKASWLRSKLYGAFFSVIDLLRNPRYAIPLLVNLTGSVWFFLLIGQAGTSFSSFHLLPETWAAPRRNGNKTLPHFVWRSGTPLINV